MISPSFGGDEVGLGRDSARTSVSANAGAMPVRVSSKAFYFRQSEGKEP